MSLEFSDSNVRVRKAIIDLQDRCSGNMMDIRRGTKDRPPVLEKRKPDFNRSFSLNSPRRLISANYFSLESLLLLIGLTASLLILPLILPPLPPPPFMLLLVPIGILAVLMILAFMPTSNARDLTYKYV